MPYIQCKAVGWSEWDQGIHLARTGEQAEAVVASTDFSLPCLGASHHPYTPHEWSLGFSSLSICPSSSPNSQGVLSPMCRTPGLKCPVCGSAHSLPRASIPLHDFPFPLGPLPGAQVPSDAFLSILLDYELSVSLLQPCLYRILLPALVSFP